ncbi:substrate-binding domain-containing protein [Acuticoccus sp. MNP-M23]|uniref:substrate-binding domain-containing protein n=1 Tax=Acuticoccus sp. MNP-M23 TaxID=3072793 RepID=UPI002814DCAD|nr:substrate-binding domain-containing protein [Acuticoccus sp. MNP-M23]WMS43771.1 substrate-binding domain-containing protein [Acuticoccus sp. MNP-M23]
MPITGLGPHGERAVSPAWKSLTPSDIAAARERRFRVAVVLHTNDSDWSRQQLTGMVGTFGDSAVVVNEVVDCGFRADAQSNALQRLSNEPLDAIISIPVANASVAEAHRCVSRAGIRLFLQENVPTGLLPGTDYTSFISADNFGLGLICAELLSPHVATGSEIGLMTYGIDFYSSNEREIAFRRWMIANRPDLTVRMIRFPSLDAVGETTRAFIDASPAIAGLFVVWDTPALAAIHAFEAAGYDIPVTTVDLGRDAAICLARGRQIVGIAAQEPFRQGVAAAETVIQSLLGVAVPHWIALPGLPVTRENVAESYQTVWRSQILEKHSFAPTPKPAA